MRFLSKRSISLASAIALAVSLVAAPSGSAVVFEQPGDFVTDPALAVDPSGASTAAWQVYPQSGPAQLRVARVGADGSAGPVREIPGAAPYSGNVDLAAHSAGLVTAVWDGPQGVQFTRIGPGGVPEPARTLAPGGSPQVAVDRSDRATVVFETGDGIGVARVGPDGMPGPVEKISPEPGFDPQLALDRRGRATVVWESGAFPRRGHAIGVARLDRSLRLVRTVVRPDPRGNGYFDPVVAADDRGRATVAWLYARGVSIRRVLALRVSPSGQLSRTIELTNARRRLAMSPRVAASGSGRATVAWTSRPRNSETRDLRVIYATFHVNGSASPARTLARNARGPAIAYNPGRARAIVAFFRVRSRGGRSQVTGVATRRPRPRVRRPGGLGPGGGLGPVHPVATEADPELGVDEESGVEIGDFLQLGLDGLGRRALAFGADAGGAEAVEVVPPGSG